MKAAEPPAILAAFVSIVLLFTTAPVSFADSATSSSSARVNVTSEDGGQVTSSTDGDANVTSTVTINGNTTTVISSSGQGGSDSDSAIIPGNVTDPGDGPDEPVDMPVEVESDAGAEGDVRLVSKVEVNGFATGAIQVFHDGAWGAVCNTGFDGADAEVACRQLGYASGVPLPPVLPDVSRETPEGVIAPFALENLGCTGNEERLLDCPADPVDEDYSSFYSYYSGSSNGCDPFSQSYATVACGTSTSEEDGAVRLTGGEKAADGSAEFGRLEVFYSGGWGTVCDNFGPRSFPSTAEFPDGAASVVCKQLGYNNGFQVQRATVESSEEERTKRVPILLAGAPCDGGEQTLTDCPGIQFINGVETCSHQSDVSVVCFNGTNEKDGDLRLAEGKAADGYEYGRLEIFLRGFWSNVCNEARFTPDSAQVACKALGYDGGAQLRFLQPFEFGALNQVLFSDIPVALAGVDCKGDEQSLLECQRNDAYIADCNNKTSNTMLACANAASGCDISPPNEEGALRLRGGFGTACDALHSGFVEVLHFDEWGAICQGRFDTEDRLAADVICRQLGFPHGTVIDPLIAIPEATGNGGSAPGSEPGPFYFYDYSDAISEEAQEPQARFWLSSVECRGPEEKLIECDLGPGFRSDNRGCGGQAQRLHVACRQFPVADALEDVKTPAAKEGDLRLVDEAQIDNWVTGQLQVFFEGSWSQICSALFDPPDADIACRQLGYGAGSVAARTPSDAENTARGSTAVFPEVAISFSGCNGTENSLLECGADKDANARGRRVQRGCRGESSPGLTLACVARSVAGEEGAIRLAEKREGDSEGSASGVLEVFHAGAWGSICSNLDFDGYLFYDSPSPSLTESSAEIACRQLGYESGIFRDILAENTTFSPPWLSSLLCVGFEPTLADCEKSEFGDTSTCSRTQRLYCSSSNEDDGRARLVGGRGDPGGSWEYGRLEVFFQGFWSGLGENSGEALGARGAQVACRSLGYAAGAQMLAGKSSALPDMRSDADEIAIQRIACEGDEKSLTDCEIIMGSESPYSYPYADYGLEQGIFDIAILCSNPSGCSNSTSDNAVPAEGDVRLVPLNSTATPTAACDDVHAGGVEYFHDGQWGRICTARFRDGNTEEFTLDALVVCRQLGFPFGGVLDTGEPIGTEYEPVGGNTDYSGEAELVWATNVVCTGKEERLADCVFPEDFEDTYYYGGYYNEVAPASAPAEAPEPAAGPTASSGGIQASCGRTDRDRLGVVCRRFEIEESDVIRR